MSTENRFRANLKRRVMDLRREYNMLWELREMDQFLDRMELVGVVEGIDDIDLRSAVRLYNREVIGRAKRRAGG